MALGYSVTDNVSLYPSIRYVGRLATDTLGVLPQTETTLVTGGGYQNDSYNRWGDYSAMQIDPSDDCTFWYTQEYAQTSGAYNWYTRIGSFKFPSCGTPDFTLSATPTTQSVCAGNNAAYTINLTSVAGFSSSVALSASGVPSGATATFSPASVTPTGSSTLTIATGTAAAGAYTIGVTGTSGSLSHSASVTLNVSTALTAAPTLTAPANGSTGIATMPTFTWGAVTGAASYDIQVASDPAFATIVASATGLTTTSYMPSSALTGSTAYYWRVRAVNGCGVGAYSALAAFVTTSGGTSTVCVSPNVSIPDNNTAGVDSSQTVAASGLLTDLNVSVQSTHTWVGDLVFTVKNVGTSTSVTIIDRPGVPASNYGCSYDNIAATLDDEAAAPVENQCASSTPAISGTFSPNNPLAAFDGQQLANTWTLNASDRASGDTGTLTQWCLIATYGSAFTADYSDLASSYGVAWHTGDGTWRLGSGWDADTYFYNGYDNLRSDGGVTRNSSDSWNDTRGEVNVTVTGTAGQYACLNAWLDYSDGAVVAGTPDTPDGQFNVANEHVVVNQVMSPGASQLVTWPLASGVINTSALYNMRFRLVPAPTPTVADCSGVTLAAADAALAPDGGAAITGGAAGGEVEDYSFSAGPTGILLASMTATAQADAIEVTWDTVSEAENAGFNLYRDTSKAGPGIKINTDLIPSQAPGSQEGYHYSYLDNGWLVPDTTYYYWLEDVSTTGVATRHEPVSVLYTGSPTAVGHEPARCEPGAAGSAESRRCW